jgi:large subunit ribosomal protein L7/L12
MTNEKKLSSKVEKIAKDIESLTALELSELASHLEEKFGVLSMPMMPTAPTGATPASAEAPSGKEEKTIFTVNLTDTGANKLAVIKAVREILPNLGLMEAKKLVESAPKELLKDVKKDAAEEAKKKIETAGGKVELK